MIARVWSGVTNQNNAEEYENYLMKTGVPGYKNTNGNRGVIVLRKDDEQKSEFTLISLWESEEAIRGFAGQEIASAVYYPKDENFLLTLEPCVEHFEVVQGN
jgi:heme-degrading monooxygenase HmoA